MPPTRIVRQGSTRQAETEQSLFRSQDPQENWSSEVQTNRPRPKRKSNLEHSETSLHCSYIIMQIQLEGFAQDARYLYFVMEFVPGGELLSYLRSVSRLESYHSSYWPPYAVCMQLKSCWSSNIYTRKTSFSGIWSLKISWSLKTATWSSPTSALPKW